MVQCRAVLDHLATWSMIVENPTISLDHDRDLFEKKIQTFVTQCPLMHAHMWALSHLHTTNLFSSPAATLAYL